MGIYSNTISFSQYRVIGNLPAKGELFDWLAASLEGRAFNSIEQSAEELSEGWTCTDRPDDPVFDAPVSFWRDRYLFFTHRRDQRRIPAALLKSHLGRAEGDELSKRPELKRLPKQLREDLTERVKLGLFARTLPAPATVDLVWQYEQGLLSLLSTSPKVMERFEELFVKSFENLRLQLIYPYSRALSLLDEPGQEQLAALNQASTESALDQIESNRWLGEEFLLWLLHGGLQGEQFQVCTQGHYNDKEPFSAWIDDKLQLLGGSEAGLQKVTVSGSQDSYLEARTAIKNGKSINSATIYLEKDEHQWRFTLNGELFTFGSFRAPSVRIERDGIEDLPELEAVFYERNYLLEAGMQMFDSLLLTWLKQRLSPGWGDRLDQISQWLEEA